MIFRGCENTSRRHANDATTCTTARPDQRSLGACSETSAELSFCSPRQMEALVRRHDVRQKILAAVSVAYHGPSLTKEELVASTAGARVRSGSARPADRRVFRSCNHPSSPGSQATSHGSSRRRSAVQPTSVTSCTS